MAAKIVEKKGSKLIVEVEMNLSGKSMLDMEVAIRNAVNEAGALGTAEALKSLDADGRPIISDDIKFTSKGEHTEKYECPYGSIVVSRQVYQSSAGGKTFCPLESSARMMLNSTPAYAKMLSLKYAHNGAPRVERDMLESNGRDVCPVYIKKVADAVGEMANIQEGEWEYDLPKFSRNVASVSVGLDGTCMLMSEYGWREAMTGSISLYDSKSERMHTVYIGAIPEYGKASFLKRLDDELAKIKERYPDCVYIGLADGAAENWSFLEKRTDRSVLDFYHVLEYVKLAVGSIYPGKKYQGKREEVLDGRLHSLKHKHGAAKRLLSELEGELENVSAKHRENLQKTVTYFRNNYKRMNYARQTRDGMPISSGVTEAACKELIKQRLCSSGMRWKEKGAASVIAIRSLVMTDKRWEQFWNKISESGCPCHKKFETI